MRTRLTFARPRIRILGLAAAGLLLALALGGCATSSGGDDDSVRGGADHIPSEELRDRLGPSVDLYEAVSRLRPQWLRAGRGVSGSGSRYEPVVYVDDTRFGPLGSLRQLRVSDVDEMRFIDAQEATTRYGTGVPAGVISVTTRGN